MAKARLETTRAVGPHTVALEIQTPPDFDAFPGQFVLVKTEIDGEAETGYYTISSPTVEDKFELTVGVDPEGTLGPWLAERSAGDVIPIEGPYGDIRYQGDEDAVVLASGPGIGPAIGIGERGVAAGRSVTIVYSGSEPPHGDRLAAFEADGGTLEIATTTEDIADRLRTEPTAAAVFVFGFAEFVDEATTALELADRDPQAAAVENFGPA